MHSGNRFSAGVNARHRFTFLETVFDGDIGRQYFLREPLLRDDRFGSYVVALFDLRDGHQELCFGESISPFYFAECVGLNSALMFYGSVRCCLPVSSGFAKPSAATYRHQTHCF